MDIPLSHIGLSLLAGGLTTLSPCVLPILPLVVGGAVQTNRIAPIAMGAGMAVSFALIGVLLGLLGPILDIDADNVRAFGAWLLFAFGLVMVVPALNERFTEWMLPIASGANNASAKLNSNSFGGALLLGGVLGFVWSPCSGPLLGSALTLVASEGGGVHGGIILGLFGFGAAIPLVAVAYASRSGFNAARDWLMPRVSNLKKVFGLIIMLTGIAILSGADKWLESHILGLLPDAWIAVTTLF